MTTLAKSIFVAVFALFLFSSMASAYTISAPTQTITVPTLSTKIIDIAISGSEPETINANILDQNPWVSLDQNQISVTPGKISKVSLYVSPFVDTSVGLYKITIIFESATTGVLKKADVYVLVEKGGVVSIEKILVIGNLQPLGSAKVDVYLKNYMKTTIQNIDVVANVMSPSENIGVLHQVVPRLDPGEEGKAEAVILFDKFAQAGTYTVDATVKYMNTTITEKQPFAVEQVAVIKKSLESTPLLFGLRKTIKMTNVGNKAGDYSVTEYFSSADTVFFYGDEPATKSGSTYTWNFKNIVPGETRFLQYSVDYTPVFLLIIVIIIAAWVYFTRIKTVRIRKYILQKKEIEEGEEFTVAVEIKNSTRHTTNTEINDFVPSVFTVKDADGPKALKKKSSIGMELTWHVKDLNPREERVLTYKITPIFGIHGTVRLPRASAIFESNGKKIERKSIAHSIGLPEKRAEDWQNAFKLKKKKKDKKPGSIF